MRGIALVFALTALAPAALRAGTAETLEPGIEQIARELSAELKEHRVEKLAVVDFSEISGYPSALSHVIAEELINQLHAAAPGAFTMVERRRLEQVRQEQIQSASKLFDQRTLADVGKILGLDAIVSGTIADLGDSIKIYASAIAVETAEVFARSSVRIRKDPSVASLLQQGAAPLPLGITGGAPPRGGLHQARDAYFQNKLVRLTPEAVSVTRDGKDATVALRLENLTSQDLFLALDKSNYCDFTLVDNSGVSSRHGSNRVTGITCIPATEASAEPAEAFTMISARSRTTILFKFHFLDPVEGDRLAFSADFLHRQGGKTSRFSAGLANLQFTRDTGEEP